MLEQRELIVAIISDIHGNLEALTSVLKDIKEKNIEQIICAGDIVGYYPHPIECIDLVRKNCKYVIQGNHDEVTTSKEFSKKINWFNEIAVKSLKWTRNKLLESDNCTQYEYLKSLKPQMEVKFNNRLIMVSHGTPDENWGYFLFPFWRKEPEPEQKSKILSWIKKWEIVILGHTHQAFVYKTRGKVVINPGSVGQPRDGDARASYGVVEFSKSGIEAKIIRLKYDVKKTCDAIFREELDDYLCQRLISGV